jgi:prolyl-tRNA editing enzyme YbaK/EbsC (Cys-tRNA(Pro) deacylase)
MSNVAKLVDDLANINAQIDALKAQAESIKGELFANGAGAYQSDAYKAVVSEIKDSVAVNYKKVAEYLQGKVSAQVYGSAIKRASGIKNGYFKVALYDL